ncbi:MAG: hypothetical protein JO293_07430 [Candidatus Eremiobacteraeota bacterium]|nr:hypothetical protein [Candidatus Eremiobacteraeota bacterium]MBV8223179.1 hypothetical protein [Candidatus Eremiobacteraeota bacterium]MBV8282160.1 hypothetical protein [Candidatus Eremiobacteraeota bacterium]
MRYFGMLLTLAIICVLAYITFRSLGLTPSSDVHDAQWFYDHPSERASKLEYCNQHPDQQAEGECLAAVTAQARADTDRAH